MEDYDIVEWPKYHPAYPIDPLYLKQIHNYVVETNKKIVELEPQLELARSQPCTEEIWCEVGDLRYGHPLTKVLLRYRTLIWLATHPPDPRGELMACRIGPYTVYVFREDLIKILGRSESTIDRLLAEVREECFIKPYGRITVEQFCFVHNLPEDKIQQQLHELSQNRWKKHKK
jgi:hypothetical protein